MSEQPPPIKPLVLSYDRQDRGKGSRARIPLPGYSVGLLAAIAVFGIACYVLDAMYLPDIRAHDEPFKLVAMVFIVWLFDVMLATMFLGFVMWLRQKIIRETGFASFRRSMIWGVVAGAFPLLSINMLPVADSYKGWMFLGALGWHCLVAVVAGFFLCFRSHVRND